MANSKALLVIDMQKQFKESANGVTERIVKVIDVCHSCDLPVILTQTYDVDADSTLIAKWWGAPLLKGTPLWEILPEIESSIDRTKDIIIGKTTYDGFHGTDLKEQLIRLGVDTVVICGVLSNVCCETTARSAFVNNFNVIFLEDGNATSSVEMHQATIMNLKFGFATIQTCEQFVATL